MITIREETENDYSQVYETVKRAFAGAEHSDGNEHNLVVQLRKSDAFLPGLSLVAVDGEKVVGHILFTRLGLGEIQGVALAPLAVLPEYQRQGIGTLLMNEGHRLAKNRGYEFSLVLGSEHYYPRVGYRPASLFGISAPFDAPDENFMALNLQGRNTKLKPVTAVYTKEFFE